MSINGTVTVHHNEDGSGHLALEGEERGQSALHYDAAPRDVTALNGRQVWGGADSLLYGETKIAERIGYTRIRFVVPSLGRVIFEEDRKADMRRLGEWLADGDLSRGPWRVSSVARQDSDGEYCGRDHYLVDADGEELAMLSSEADAQVCALARNHVYWLMKDHKRLFREVRTVEGILSNLALSNLASESYQVQRIRELKARVKVLEEALRPFAEWADRLMRADGDPIADDRLLQIVGWMHLYTDRPCFGDLRRAAAVLEGHTDGP